MSGPDAFAGVWQPGAGTQWVRAGLSWDQFKAQDTTYFGQGLRVTSLAIRDTRFAAVWRPGTGAQWIRPGLSWEQFKAQDTTYFGQGLRVGSLAIENGRYAAVWRPGSGAQWIRTAMTWDEFKGHDATYFAQGLRVTTLEFENGKYTAVWRPGSGTQWVRGGMSFGELAGHDRTYFARGLRITSLAYENGRYAAVWRPGSGAQWWSSRRGAVDFATEDNAYFQRGLRLAALEIQNDPVGAYRYPWAGGTSCRVGQGNNNASGSHTPGQSQAFAFDFSLPAGTTIRAARAGTVEWLQENLTATFNPNQAQGPSSRCRPTPPTGASRWPTPSARAASSPPAARPSPPTTAPDAQGIRRALAGLLAATPLLLGQGERLPYDRPAVLAERLVGEDLGADPLDVGWLAQAQATDQRDEVRLVLRVPPRRDRFHGHEVTGRHRAHPQVRVVVDEGLVGVGYPRDVDRHVLVQPSIGQAHLSRHGPGLIQHRPVRLEEAVHVPRDPACVVGQDHGGSAVHADVADEAATLQTEGQAAERLSYLGGAEQAVGHHTRTRSRRSMKTPRRASAAGACTKAAARAEGVSTGNHQRSRNRSASSAQRG